ncbi:C40 family peptidase [Streptomyces sp. VRA16 Mangrove soil]|uniref:C40 family peptidase n=1 Tax=Streptomyces sp. VRA16 Mangrove soil TaxID=2817434 RepID=UPI001A9FF4B3|nr:C40 family peptidase [Streptomyces sp. VRA16 Mangrove soil]MBO1337469.1 C40 family peptidase [Streptomyces sp. VRA16 Mangrove soil]
MSKQGTSRTALMAAVALVCAVTVLAAPGAAFAAPAPTPSPSTTPAGSKPLKTKDLEAVRAKIDKLYHDAAVATDAYNAATEKAEKQSVEIVKLAQKIAAGQSRLDRLRSSAGAAAREQYRTGGIPRETQFLLSGDPQLFLDNAGRLHQGQQATKNLLSQLTKTQEELAQYADDASAKWKQLDEGAKEKAAAKKKVEKQIKEAQQLENKLEKKERERLRKLEEEAEQKRQTAWLSSGVLKEINGKATPAGKKAVQFATAQLGKPYVWGAEGPKSYDCSGLTSQAWAAAGHGIPRTSQEQWKQLKHIDVKDMRPGDLIIYHDDASHVGMYIGDGAIIHAPRPGRTVTVAGAGSMAILGVVRPDA